MGISFVERKRRQDLRDRVLTEEFLRKAYLERGLSANQIAEELRLEDNTLTATMVIRYLQRYRISTRNVKQACNLPEKRKRTEKTNLEKYGAINPLSKGTAPQIKRDLTVLERYGVSNVRQAPGFIEKIKKQKGRMGR